MDGQSLNTFVEGQNEAESAEHVAAMLEKADQIEANNQEGDESRPEWLPEKFSNVQQMAEAYRELEQKMGRGEKAEETNNTEELSEEEIVNTSASDVESLINKNGLSFDVLQNEFQQYGNLTEDSYEALEEAGFPRPVVETWLSGQLALADGLKNTTYAYAGGEETYNKMLEWAGDNLSENEISAFNKVIATADTNMIGLAVNGLMSKFKANAEPTLMRGGTGAVSSERFNSTAELTAAMSDPKYHKDPAYREKVSRMLAKSSIF